MIVGPPEDPAGVASCRSAAEALGRIRSSGASFVSRGDNSGTHTRELELWALAGASPRPPTSRQARAWPKPCASPPKDAATR